MRPKHVLVAAIATLLLVFAYSPLFRAGLVAEDYAVLLDGAAFGEGALFKPLTAASLRLSAWIAGFPGAAGSVAAGGAGAILRAEQLLYLVLAAVGLGCFVRRLLLPWSGSEQATGTGRAAALLFAVHPLAVWSVAHLGARANLLGLTLAIWSAYCFLRGRQDRVALWTALALIAAIAAGFASHLAFGLPPLLCAAELASTHRYRPLRTRMRTAATTLVLFGAGVSLDFGRVFLQEGETGVAALFGPLQGLDSYPAALARLSLAAEKLGLFILPANPAVIGFAGIAAAGTVFLVALQPALTAARSAPRLWGWLLVGWLLALFVSQVLHIDVRIAPGELGRMHAALPSIAVMAAGLGLCATALSGRRRPYSAWIVAIGYACLGHANARPWPGAALDAAELRQDLFAAHDIHGRVRTLVLDPPGPAKGVVGVGDWLPYLAHPELQAGIAEAPDAPEAAESAGAQTAPEVRGMSSDAFLALLAEPEFQAWLGDATLLLYPRAALGSAGVRGGLMRRPYTLLEPLAASTGPLAWRRSFRSPGLDLSPREVGALRVTLGEGLDPEKIGRVSWRFHGASDPDRGSLAGAWTEAGGPTGWFDLESSLAWRVGGRVRSMLFEEAQHAIDTATLQPALPALNGLRPEVRAEDWHFDAPVVESGYSGGTWRLRLLDLVAFEVLDFSVLVEPDGTLRVAGVQAECSAREVTLAWILEYRVEGFAVARERGRV